MSRLHILNKSDDEAAAPIELLRVLQAGDTVLLIENAVVLGTSGSSFAAAVSKVENTRLFALAEDCAMRGITPACETTDYAGFVELSVACPQSISWF